MKRLRVIAVLFICAILVLTGCRRKEELKVHFIDVGQGDSILVDLGTTEILIDGGEKTPGVVTYITRYIDGALELMIATHPHTDHIGGLIPVLNAFTVQEVWLNGDTSESQTYAEFSAAVKAEGAKVHTARRGDKTARGKLNLAVLHPAALVSKVNNNSIVFSLSYGAIDFLFTGDAEQEAEAQMLSDNAISVPKVEILKVGHHGSRTASSRNFLAATSPGIAIYMAGKGNQYGHPHPETIERLEEIGAKIYGTDTHGTIVITTNGQTFNIRPEK